MLTKDIAYEIDGRTYTGYLATDDAHTGDRPGILVCHQGGGLTDHAKERARMLAAEGYIAFALDMYGELPSSVERAMVLLRGLTADPAEMQKRATAGFDVLKSQPHVDRQRLAAAGYCFGGSLVLELARIHPELACVASFHPGLTNQADSDSRPVYAKVLVCAGADDPHIPAAAREKFIALMTAAKADWHLIVYGNACHSFTDKSIDAYGFEGFAYDAPTDRRSWAGMLQLFQECFGSQ